MPDKILVLSPYLERDKTEILADVTNFQAIFLMLKVKSLPMASQQNEY